SRFFSRPKALSIKTVVAVKAISVQHMVEKGFSTPLAGALLSLNGLVNALSRAAAGELGQRLKPKTLTV
ncbi:hypothetical protein, partial [Staphylococcus aureus]|uniref:hypothetical protein n=1 Tax=Staphylococcus aureus TaxID=1280 RepID=UPI0019151825